jgi:simple sugar transport system permease protein
MMLWRGILLGQSGGYPQPLRQYLPEGSSQFINLFIGTIGPIPIQIIWFALFGLILSMLLHLHKFGNWVFATGNNKDAARAMGINTDTTKIISFAIVGFLCAFTAIIITIHHRTFYALTGQFYELKAIAASVVGGTSLSGGVGSMPGIILGALTIPLIENGLTLLRVEYYWVYIFYGLIIILFTVLNKFLEKKKLEAV